MVSVAFVIAIMTIILTASFLVLPLSPEKQETQNVTGVTRNREHKKATIPDL